MLLPFCMQSKLHPINIIDPFHAEYYFGMNWGQTMPAKCIKVRPRSFQNHPKVKSYPNLHNVSHFVRFIYGL